MRLHVCLAAAALLLPGSLAAPALAQAPAAAVQPAQQAADEKALMAALQALNQGRYPALRPHIATLQQVLARAPAQTSDPETADIYATAALLLTMNAVEDKKPADAVRYGERGLALAGNSPELTTEVAQAYTQLKRYDDSVRLIDGWLARNPSGDNLTRARMHRSRGFALIELKRLDEAEQAYRTSLTLEPDHKGAANELTYIAGLKQGKAPTSVLTTTYDKAKDGTYEEPPKK